MMRKQLIVALDTSDSNVALGLVRQLRREVGIFKVGLQLFSACGPEIVKKIRELEGEVFLDLKLHDIPNTVRHAVLEAVRLDVCMLTLHTAGGEAMLAQAAAAVRDFPGSRTRLLGVTILTSLRDQDLAQIGLGQPIRESVLLRAKLAARAGLDGIVASPHELALLRRTGPPGLLIVTPGIRPAGAARHDQARVATPRGAIFDGADFLVVGRPITQSEDPVAAARAICEDMLHAKIRD